MCVDVCVRVSVHVTPHVLIDREAIGGDIQGFYAVVEHE